MKLSLGASLLALLLGGGAVTTLFACATTEDEAPPTTPVPEAGLPPVDAAAEAARDAGRDGDAALPPCSAQGFCPVAVPASESLRAVWADGAGGVWAVSAEGHVLRADATASPAFAVHATLTGALFAVWGSSPTDVWVGGEKGLFHGTGTSASTLAFTAAPAPGATALAITAIWGTSATDVWAVGGLGPDREVFPYGPARARVLHLTGSAAPDAGAPWVLDPVSSKAVGITRVWGSATGGVWLAGLRAIQNPDLEGYDEGVVYRRAPGATAFAEVALPTIPGEGEPFDRLAKLTGGVTTGDGTVWVLGQTGSSIPFYWRGTPSGNAYTFTLQSGSLVSGQPALLAVSAAGPVDAWAVGELGSVRHGTGQPGGWATAGITRTDFPITVDFHGVHATAPNDVWIVGDGLALHLDPSQTKGTP